MFRSILVAVDTQEPSTWAKALPVAISLAKTYGARLAIVTVIPDLRAMAQAQWSAIAYHDLVNSAHESLGSLLAQFPDAAGATTKVASGSIWRGIIEAAKQAEGDLIVLASHRPEMKDYLIGANAVSVVRHAPCSVMVVRD